MSGGELRGRTVAVLQSRHGAVFADLISGRGGLPLLAPTMREEEAPDLAPLHRVLRELRPAGLELAIFQTGVGAARLLEQAAAIGLQAVLRERLAGAVVVVRGPKPLSALLGAGIRVDRRTASPHTTTELLALLEGEQLNGSRVLVQEHGAANLELADWLQARGAQVLHAFTYRWALPADLGPVHRFLAELEAGRVDYTVFTSASQFLNLLAIASAAGAGERLQEWLRERTRIASIGPTTTACLLEHGLEPAVQPVNPKMVPLLQAICADAGPAAV